MCVSIVIAVNLTAEKIENFKNKIINLTAVYQYGIGIGCGNLHPECGPTINNLMSQPNVIFELHDLPEPHCACDIDDDIRLGSKNGYQSKFFDFVRETLECTEIASMSVLFFQEELPNENNVRKQLGNYEDFVSLINKWSTWQLGALEPTRKAYYIADASPLLYTFTWRNLAN